MDTKKLKQKILDLAIHGKLVPQDPNDEPASALLTRIREEKLRLVKEGKIKKAKKSDTADTACCENVPFEVPQGWEWCTLGEIFETSSAKRVLKSDWKSEGIPFYRAREIVQLSKEGIADKDLFITQELYDELKEKYGVPSPGDIMISAVGSIGYTYIVGDDVFYYKDASVLCLSNLFNVNPELISLWFKTTVLRKQMYENSKGTTVDTITLEKLNSYQIPIPPLNEQHRIVAEIEKWFSLIDTIESSKTDLQTSIKQAKSKILDLAIRGKLVPQDPADEPATELLKRVNPKAQIATDIAHYGKVPEGWCFCNLSSVAKILDNMRKPINSAERARRISNKEDKELFPYYGATGLVGKIDDYLVDGKFILLGEDGAPFLDKYAQKAYTIDGKAWVNNHAHILLPLCDHEYLLHYLNALDYSDYVKGSTRLKLTQQDMSSIKIFLPPLAEQKRIVSKIETLFNTLDAIAENL